MTTRRTSGIVPVGLDRLDRIMPLRRGRLHLVAGPPSMGKSTFLGSLALGAARGGSRVLFVAAGDSPFETTARLAAACARTDRPHGFPGHLPSEVARQMERGKAELDRLPLRLVAEPLPTLEEIHGALRPAGNVDLLLVDDLHCVEAPGLGLAAACLRWLGRWLRVPVVASLRVPTPERADPAPRLTDLPREAVRAADVSLVLHREAYFKPPAEGMSDAARSRWEAETTGCILWDREGVRRAFGLQLVFREGPRFA